MTRSRTRSNASRPAFTLIELLVVIAIIAGLDRALPAGRQVGPRGRPPRPVHQQLQADRPGPAQLRELQRRLSPRRRVDQLQLILPAVASSQFVDGGWSTLARILPYMEGGTAFNALNFNLAEYNDAYGANYTGASQVMAVFLCPSSTRSPDGGRDGVDPNDTVLAQLNNGYGYNDYGPTVYTDISPVAEYVGLGARLPWIPYRDKNTRANGMLKQGKTRIAEVTDGTSNTIAIAEDAGRDPRYLSPYTEGY